MNNLDSFPSIRTEIKTPWEKSSWGQLQRYHLSVDPAGEIRIVELSKGVLSFLSDQICCLSRLQPFSPKKYLRIEISQQISEDLLSRLNEEQRTYLVNWKKLAKVNQLPNVHNRLDAITAELDQMIPKIDESNHKRQCLEVLRDEIGEQKRVHLSGLQAAASSLALQQAGYLFLERANLLEELFNLYRTEY